MLSRSEAMDEMVARRLPESRHVRTTAPGRVATRGHRFDRLMVSDLLRKFAFRRESGKVNFSGCSPARLLAPPAIAAQYRLGPDISLGALVPPLLLMLSPNLGDAARLAIERHVDVVSPFDEVGRSVAVRRAKVLRIHQYVPLGQGAFGRHHFSRAVLRAFGFPGSPLDASALQYRESSVTGRFHIQRFCFVRW